MGDVKRKARKEKEAPVGPRRRKKSETAAVEMRVVGVEKKERRHRLTSFEDDEADAIIKKPKLTPSTELSPESSPSPKPSPSTKPSPKPSTSRHRSPFRKY